MRFAPLNNANKVYLFGKKYKNLEASRIIDSAVSAFFLFPSMLIKYSLNFTNSIFDESNLLKLLVSPLAPASTIVVVQGVGEASLLSSSIISDDGCMSSLILNFIFVWFFYLWYVQSWSFFGHSQCYFSFLII